jgi:hypothetical protein
MTLASARVTERSQVAETRLRSRFRGRNRAALCDHGAFGFKDAGNNTVPSAVYRISPRLCGEAKPGRFDRSTAARQCRRLCGGEAVGELTSKVFMCGAGLSCRRPEGLRGKELTVRDKAISENRFSDFFNLYHGSSS